MNFNENSLKDKKGKPKEYEYLFIENVEKNIENIEKMDEKIDEKIDEKMPEKTSKERLKGNAFKFKKSKRGVKKRVVLLLCLAFFVGGMAAGAYLNHNGFLKMKVLQEGQPVNVGTSIVPATPTEEVKVPPAQPKEPYKAVIKAPTEEAIADAAFFQEGVLYGDSITEGIILYNMIDGNNIIASKGMNITEAHKKIEEVKAKNPKRVFVLLGINDLADYNRTVEKVIGQYIAFYETLHQELPDAKIYVQSLFPVAEKYNNTKSLITNEKINQFNAAIKESIKNDGVYYVDIHGSLCDETGFLNSEITLDGMHLKRSYYEYWMNLLAENVKNLEAYYND